jgi:hypothetical protein
MRYIAVLLVIGLAVWVGTFAYRLWMRPIDQPTQAMNELEARFNSLGIPGDLYPVRHAFPHSKVAAAAAYEIRDYPLPVGIAEYASEQYAVSQSVFDSKLPEQLQPIRIGKLVLTFDAWGDDTFNMADNVRRVSGGNRVAP